MEKIGIGLIGYGGIGKIHTLCYKDIEMYPFTKVVIDSSVTIGSTYQDQDVVRRHSRGGL